MASAATGKRCPESLASGGAKTACERVNGINVNRFLTFINERYDLNSMIKN